MEHKPVLPEAVLLYLAPQAGEAYLDTTAGYGGHAKSILDKTHNGKNSVLVDRDLHAIKQLEKQFEGQSLTIIQSDFLQAAEELRSEGSTFDIILADLGVSSPHFDNASRGFSFSLSGPLDMRMDQDQELTAYDIVNKANKEELAQIIKKYGEEPRARRIADAITKNRPVKTTDQLAQIIARTIGGSARRNRVHPATKTFQALRIAVNDELGQLEKALPIWLDLLNPGGRLAIISFHSLEDRIVKHGFAEVSAKGYDSQFTLLTKKPVVADANELAINPRSRSAKLRAVAKIKKERSS